MSWQKQQINKAGGNTPDGPATVTRPCVSVYNGQQHIGYRDSSGIVWDSFYRPDLGPHGTWELQHMNGPNGNTPNDVGAVAGPFIGIYHDQQHFAYIDAEGNIWDSWYDGSHWHLQRESRTTRQ